LREAGIEIPSPQRDINFRKGFVRVELTGPQKEPERTVAEGA
jgi:small-conductance mechanosensitive channel